MIAGMSVCTLFEGNSNDQYVLKFDMQRACMIPEQIPRCRMSISEIALQLQYVSLVPVWMT